MITVSLGTQLPMLLPLISSTLSLCVRSLGAGPQLCLQGLLQEERFHPCGLENEWCKKVRQGVLVAVTMKFSCTGAGNMTYVTRQLCYVCDKVDRVYLRRQALTDLCCITPQFPNPQSVHTSACIGDSEDSPGSCPTRPANPPP